MSRQSFTAIIDCNRRRACGPRSLLALAAEIVGELEAHITIAAPLVILIIVRLLLAACAVFIDISYQAKTTKYWTHTLLTTTLGSVDG